jgi:hypothetical protein
MSRNPKIKKSFTKTEFTPWMVQEMKKCMEDPVYFIRNYVYILHPKRGRIKFELYDFQEDMIRAYQNNRWCISKIARQSGKTETTCAFLMWYALFHDDKTILVAANKLGNAKEIIHRVANMYEELPDWLKPGIDDSEWNKTSLSFENKSKIMAQATSINTGRGFAISLLYLDELAFVAPHIQQAMWASIQPVLSTGGACIVSSTPNGSTDLYSELFRSAEAKISPFHAISVKWDRVPGRDEKFKEEQIALIGQRRWDQEFECMFLSSDQALIDTLKLQRAEKTVSLVEATIGELFNQDFWKLPHRNGTYIIGVDPSEGVGLDYSVIEVFEFPSMEQVMEYRTNDQSPPTLYSVLKTILSFFERNSLMTYYSVESNAIGQALIALYEADEKPPMKAVFMYEEGADKVGFKTTNASKMKALIAFKELFERGNIKLNSKPLISELKTLVRKDNTFKAQTGATDDCVMAVMICMRIMEQMAEYDMNAFTKLYSFQHVRVDPWAIKETDELESSNWEDDMLPFLTG